MSATNVITEPTPGLDSRSPLYYGWVNLSIAALAMLGTLPGRTQGLGLITEPLLRDLQIDRIAYAQINFWATLMGAFFCIGVGRLLDRFGSRSIMGLLVTLLGAVVVFMSGVTGFFLLFIAITLTRGLGQSALSVASLNLVGQWFRKRLNKAMGVYSILVSMAFMLAFPLVGWTVLEFGWRVAWSGIGWLILGLLLPLVIIFVRRNPESCGIDNKQEQFSDEDLKTGYTFKAALRTPAFWVFALATSTYNLIVSGIGLFNESILLERGFEAGIYHRALAVIAISSLLGNFLGGWLTSNWRANRVMALAMSLLVISLVALPFLNRLWQVMAWAMFMGIVGGFVIVLFFSFWSKHYGRRELGRIQGSAQMLTVLASAIGPWLLAGCVDLTGSYAPVLFILAFVVGVLAVTAWLVKLPKSYT